MCELSGLSNCQRSGQNEVEIYTPERFSFDTLQGRYCICMHSIDEPEQEDQRDGGTGRDTQQQIVC